MNHGPHAGINPQRSRQTPSDRHGPLGWLTSRVKTVMRRQAGRQDRREAGQAVVELALAMPVLLLLVTAILQFGSMYNTYEALTDAARGGARELSLGRGLSDPCDPAVQQTIQGTFGDFSLPSSDVTPSFATSSGGATTTDYCGATSSTSGTACTPYVYDTSCNSNGNENEGDEAKVTISYPYTLSIFGMSVFHLTLTASAADAVE